MLFENLLTNLKNSLIIQDAAPETGNVTLNLFFEKLSESTRNKVKRCKERCLEEAVQLLRQTSVAQLRGLEEKHLLLLVRLLISLQLEMVSISTACRKVDQMLLHLTKVDHQLVFRETLHSFHSIVHRNQVLSLEDLQKACMFLEDSSVGREVWRDSYKSMLSKVSELLPVVLQDESLRDGPLCYVAVKTCLQMFQLLSREVAPHVWEQDHRDPVVQTILQALMDIILGQCSNRDARLLAGTAVTMLITTASESRAGGEAAWSLLQVSHQKPWQLMVGALQRTTKLPWETRALYHRLCALLPYLGTEMVLDQYPELFGHLLKCFSTNHLSPCGSELYKCLIQQQRRELCGGSENSSHPAEVDLAKCWAKRWQPFVLEALRSDVSLLQSSSSSHLLPATFKVFPSAVNPLLASLDPQTHGNLRAWVFILSCYRAVTGSSPWSLQGGSTVETLQLALRSADDKIRLAALDLLCCSSKTKDAPSKEEVAMLREFTLQNLNCESSSFRQHFQASVRKFLVRIRDDCLAQIRRAKSKKEEDAQGRMQSILKQIEFVEWLSWLPYSFLAPGHSFQRKKTALLLLSAVLETCTDTWSPDKKKGQPPANMGALIACARQRGLWDFFSRTKQLVLISCLEDSTNEIRELSSELLLRFFPSPFSEDVAGVLDMRTKQLLCSPRVQEAQMGALMMKVLVQKSGRRCEASRLMEELEEHYQTAKSDTMLTARTKPIHGVLCALQRCLLETPERVCDALDHSVMEKMLGLLENISLLLIAVLYGDSDARSSEKCAPPSFCDMGNAISSLISQQSGGGAADEEECVLLSEEHSLVLTCCWVSLKEIGVFLGSLVEKVLTEAKQGGECLLTKPDLTRAAKVFKDILLKCRHWGAVEGCCAGFTKFCASLLSCSDPQIKEIPAQILKEGLQPFLLGELKGAAQNLQGPRYEAKLHLQPSLYPVLTLLAQLQPGIQDSSETLLDFLPPLLQLSASPIYSVRVMASKALVAMAPPSRYADILLNLSAQLPRSQQESCSHNQLHGQLLQIRTVAERALRTHSDLSSDLREVMNRVQTSLWLVTEAQRCPLVRAAYVSVVDCLRGSSCENFLSQLSDRLIHDLITPQEGLQVGLSSFQGEAVHFLCADPQWACKTWGSFSSASVDVKLLLVVSLLERRGLQQTGLTDVVRMVLQSNLKEALLSDSVEYRTTFLTALVVAMADSDSPRQPPQSEPFLAECLDLLLKDLEEQKGGLEFLSQALNASSLLLSRGPNSRLKLSGLQRWCGILESHQSPDAPEVLRMACSEALCVAGVPIISSLREQNTLSVIIMRLINTGLYLLQDQNQQVRLKAAWFSSLLHRASGGDNQGSISFVQVNVALPLLLDLLLQECWETPGMLEVLLSHLPQSDLRSVLTDASAAAGGCTSLYEQDEANVFAEPSVMSAHVLPYLLQMAEKSSQSSALAQTLRSWAEGNAAQVLDHLTVCEKLQLAEKLTPSWLALLTDPRFHITLCGLLSRVAFLLRLLKLSAGSEHLCDPLSVQERLQDVCKQLGQNGVHFPSDLTAAVAGGLPE
uniref:Uncharacterized protein n=1 Tax=Iconisemion striatum TaxID=60296 RepID=A0A1A7Z6S5_9TELE